MITIFDVANWFLTKEAMTHKKLQKLCYYAQAWHLALFKKKFFNEKFQAWIHGAVNYELYQKYKCYGWTKIPNLDIELKFNDEELDFLDRVWATYGEYDGHQLEAFTYTEDPWIKARNGLTPLQSSNNIISEIDMQNYYFNKYAGD